MNKKLKSALGNWVVGDQFWNRENEVKTFIRLIDEGAHILLGAPRRIGKTSIMREVARIIENRFICLNVDLQKSYSTADAVVELSMATHPYQNLWSKTQEVFRNVFINLKDSIDSLKIDDLTLTLRSGLTSGDWKIKGDRLFDCLANSDKPVVIFFDEVAILINRLLKGEENKITSQRIVDADAFLSWLRENSIRHKGKVRIVMSGSIGIEPILNQVGLSASLNTFFPFDLKPWDSQTAISCLEALANQCGIFFGKGYV